MLGIAALSLLVYSLVHHYTDPVRYGWGLSPYLFPVILSAVLLFLALALLLQKTEKRQDGKEAER